MTNFAFLRPVPWSRLSTGTKMLIILAVALLPLGLVALFASRESAHVNQLRHEAEVRALATAGAVTIADAIRPPTFGLRQSMDDLLASENGARIDRAQCRLRLDALVAQNDNAVAFAMFDPGGHRICATAHYASLPVHYPIDRSGFEVRISGEKRHIWSNIASANGGYFGVVIFSPDRLSHLIQPARDAPRRKVGLLLRQGSQIAVLASGHSATPLDQVTRVSVPVAGGQLSLEMRAAVNPMGALEILMILLPILMWAAGAVIGWAVVDRLLLLPLGQMQRAVAAFNDGREPLVLPRINTPALEIRDLGKSFSDATEALTRHERELAEGLSRQKKLTREVHHRVKNNLQVVSSLINLHARGAQSDAIAEAYASIQRRVDALAVVHRNYYAELEENYGVSLRTLISEIASNLRASDGRSGRQLTITLDLVSASANQDFAVPVAFFITEVVELAMECQSSATIAIALTLLAGQPEKARLAISSPVLALPECREGSSVERFQRIVGGLARQLRSPLEIDFDAGRYAVEIMLLRPMTEKPQGM